MLRLLFIILILGMATGSIWAQGNDTDLDIAKYWKTLQKVKIKAKLDKVYNEVVYYPKFNKRIRSLEGKVILLKGYLTPANIDNERTILSMISPNRFWGTCGGANLPVIETSVRLNTKNHVKDIDGIVTVKGILRLNEDDNFELFYILDDAEIVQETNQN